jgi:hypothetical protein
MPSRQSMTYAPAIRFTNSAYRVYLNPTPDVPAIAEDLDEGPVGPFRTRAEASVALEALLSARWFPGVVINVAGTPWLDVAGAIAAIRALAVEV